ncbi:hypothetical protein BDQ17DRAFT_1232158 [Cyathus striatus]|nr:hypothetical protein BDQ17DRAFT_1232158 [Cyathus striatus]
MTKIATGNESLKKHDVYYMPQGNTVIQVEYTLFKVDLAVLQKHSSILQSITASGAIFTDKHPLVLHEVTENDFFTLLKVLYPL